MFGRSSTEEKRLPALVSSTPSNALNAIVKGTVVEGTIKCENDLRVDGHIKGKLNCSAKVIIGPTGSVEGEIRCQNAVIEGKFHGVLHVSELLHVRDTALVDGDIFANKLTVQSGARFNAACKMESGLGGNGSAKNFDGKNTAHAAVAGGKTEVRN